METIGNPLMTTTSYHSGTSNSLMQGMTKSEVHEALKSMKPYKAPGPNGIQPVFFQWYWDIVSDSIHTLVENASATGSFDPELAKTLVVLIPKDSNPTTVHQFCLTSLCNVVYKILTKVLVQRIYSLLDDIISPLQSILIPGRTTSGNILVAQELMHSIWKVNKKNGGIAVKLGLAKTYDRGDWRFPRQTLIDFGFPRKGIELIMHCVTASSLSIVWNSTRLPCFSPQRGLRQGDISFSFCHVRRETLYLYRS